MVLESKQYLTCLVIDASQQLLKQETLLLLSELQAPQNGKQYRFKLVPGCVIQILNIQKSHWITVSSIGCELGTVHVYDRAHAFINLDTELQICSFVRPSCCTLTILKVNIQRQPNGYDCGLFDIAKATELALGRDMILCYWDSTMLVMYVIIKMYM